MGFLVCWLPCFSGGYTSGIPMSIVSIGLPRLMTALLPSGKSFNTITPPESMMPPLFLFSYVIIMSMLQVVPINVPLHQTSSPFHRRNNTEPSGTSNLILEFSESHPTSSSCIHPVLSVCDSLIMLNS
jgi:hypothetical protein